MVNTSVQTRRRLNASAQTVLAGSSKKLIMGGCPAARLVQITIAKQTNFVQAFARELLAKDTRATRALTGRAIHTSTVRVRVRAQAMVLVARPKRYVEGPSICRARAPPRLAVAKGVQVGNTKKAPAIGLHRASPR